MERRKFLELAGMTTLGLSLGISPAIGETRKFQSYEPIVPVTGSISTTAYVEETDRFYNGLAMEKAYQEKLAEIDGKREGTNLIILGDPETGTSLDLGSTRLAAKTLEKSLSGKTIIRDFRSDLELLLYLANPNDPESGEKFKNIYVFSHGDSGSFWLDAIKTKDSPPGVTNFTAFSNASGYLDRTDLVNLDQEKLEKIKERLTNDAVLKSYACHTATNRSPNSFGNFLAHFLGINVIGANSWVYAKSVGKDNYYFPATRRDFAKLNNGAQDESYIGHSEWILFK